MEPIILASGSKQRQDYFKLLDLPFSSMPTSVDEHYDKWKTPETIAEEIALRKVNKVAELFKDQVPPWICGADTVISLDRLVIGKAHNRDDAKEILSKLQGRDHEVITAIALFNGKTHLIDRCSVLTVVTFAALSDQEIEAYLNTGEWQGAAGAYRIQGLAGCFVKGIKGSYSGVVGLPLHELYRMLLANGYPYSVS
ncbi:MAG: Maf family protein [Treponema sp.]|jgi:septum formation protein|nr:Maf family protein [Treponema sp.]